MEVRYMLTLKMPGKSAGGSAAERSGPPNQHHLVPSISGHMENTIFNIFLLFLEIKLKYFFGSLNFIRFELHI